MLQALLGSACPAPSRENHSGLFMASIVRLLVLYGHYGRVWSLDSGGPDNEHSYFFWSELNPLSGARQSPQC